MAYEKVNWTDMETPVNADNLNHMDNQILDNSAQISSLRSFEANASRQIADVSDGLFLCRQDVSNVKEELDGIETGTDKLIMCNKGEFGDACTKDIANAVSGTQAGNLVSAGLMANELANNYIRIVDYGNQRVQIPTSGDVELTITASQLGVTSDYNLVGLVGWHIPNNLQITRAQTNGSTFIIDLKNNGGSTLNQVTFFILCVKNYTR